jgi:DNA-binding NtrC family response regulator
MKQVYRRDHLEVSNEALQWLKSQDWPGNIRQLKHLIERTMLMSSKPILEINDFHLTVQMESPESKKTALPQAGSLTLEEMEKAMIIQCLNRYSGNLSKVADALGLSRPALYRRLEKYGLTP